MIKRPTDDIDILAEEVYWCNDWGTEPQNEIDIARTVRERLKSASKF